MTSRVAKRWWILTGVSIALASACGGDSGDDEAKSCKVGTETCPCYRDETCEGDLVCLSDICVYDPDSAPGATGGRGNNGSNPQGGDADPGAGGDPGGPEPVAGNGTGPGAGGDTGTTPSGGGTTGNPRGGSSGMNPSNGGAAPTGGPTPVERYGALSVTGTDLVDESGNPVKLEGVSTMWLNWEPTGYARSAAGLVWMRDNWNLRLFRIAMGAYHEDDSENTYLANPAQNIAWVDEIVQNAIDAGVYVIIDWHEHDALSHQAEASAFFDDMSKRWGSYPNVIYEVFNEPLALDWTTELKPFHESLVATIRANDPDNVIVLGTPNWDQDVDVAAGNPLSGTNLMYALHFYACSHAAAERNRAKAALSAGLPLFVTEWGSTHADGGLDGVVCEPETRAWHDWMDQENISWAAWKLDGCEDSTCLFKDRDVPVDGGWTTDMLNGHAPLVIDEMLNGPSGSGGAGGQGGGGAGSGGGSGIDLGERPDACALVETCPSCCTTTGVFALDASYNDMTAAYVTAWAADATQASASFAFTGPNETGAIFFRFSSVQFINAFGLDSLSTGGYPEVAFTNTAAESGCVYVDSSSGWLENGCWGDADYSFDQIEIRVRSTGSGPATLQVNNLLYD